MTLRTSMLLLVALAITPLCGAAESTHFALPNPLILEAQGSRDISATITWQPDKHGHPQRVKRIDIKHPHYTHRIPQSLLTDLVTPDLLFQLRLYVDPSEEDRLYLIVPCGEHSDLHLAMFIITSKDVVRADRQRKHTRTSNQALEPTAGRRDAHI